MAQVPHLGLFVFGWILVVLGMIRFILLLVFSYTLNLNVGAQIPGSLEFNFGLYSDLRYVQRQDINHDYSMGLTYGIAYEFNIWSKLNFNIGANLVNVDTEINDFESQSFTTSGPSTSIGTFSISGLHYEIPIALTYYVKPRVWRIGFGVSLLSKFEQDDNYFYTETFYNNSMMDPVVLNNATSELHNSNSSGTFFISLGYNLKIKKYRYLTFLLRYGNVPFTGSTKEAIVPRYFAFTVGYKLN